MIFEVVLLGVSILFLVYLWLKWNYNYWKNAGVSYKEPSLIFGNQKDLLFMKYNNGIFYDNIYREFPEEPAVGLYTLRQPELLIRDIDLAKTVLIKEFDSFHDNKAFVDEELDPVIGKNPFFLTGEKWKRARALHTPAFTTTKLKGMLQLMVKVSQDMVDFVKKNENVSLDAKYFGGQFTTDSVASSVFGLSTNSFTDPNSTFRKMTAKLFEPGDKRFAILAMVASMEPRLLSLLRIRFLSQELYDFFTDVIQQVYNHRIRTGEERNDFLQFFVKENTKSETPRFTKDEVTAYTMTFMFDGYETSSIAIAYTLYALSIHKDVQEKLREEVQNSFLSFNQVDFDKLQTLTYLDAVLNETLRVYPPASPMVKVCTKDITLNSNGRSYPIKKGQSIVIPIFSIHRDSQYHSNPDEFDVTRFLGKSGNIEGFLPFGMGPRACLGQRFAITQVKMAIATLVSNFEILQGENPPKFEWDNTCGVFMLPKGGISVKFRSLK